KEMEWFLRVGYMLPLHDATRERAAAREQMKRIEARSEESGRVAALVDYAVGRGHLALREDKQAHERLSRARAAGLDTPELHYALGLVLGRLYDRALSDAPKERAGEIETRYLRPALASMKRSRGGRLESPSYLEGLIAYYQKDYDAALRL